MKKKVWIGVIAGVVILAVIAAVLIFVGGGFPQVTVRVNGKETLKNQPVLATEGWKDGEAPEGAAELAARIEENGYAEVADAGAYEPVKGGSELEFSFSGKDPQRVNVVIIGRDGQVKDFKPDVGNKCVLDVQAENIVFAVEGIWEDGSCQYLYPLAVY